ncbi:MAG: hypothetical protein JWO31_648 [Phycisphaerales bacterium]|nr:hypothetical protein [Phycisphaerales bacterium]
MPLGTRNVGGRRPGDSRPPHAGTRDRTVTKQLTLVRPLQSHPPRRSRGAAPRSDPPSCRVVLAPGERARGGPANAMPGSPPRADGRPVLPAPGRTGPGPGRVSSDPPQGCSRPASGPPALHDWNGRDLLTDELFAAVASFQRPAWGELDGPCRRRCGTPAGPRSGPATGSPAGGRPRPACSAGRSPPTRCATAGPTRPGAWTPGGGTTDGLPAVHAAGLTHRDAILPATAPHAPVDRQPLTGRARSTPLYPSSFVTI